MRSFILFATMLLFGATVDVASSEDWPLQPLSPRSYDFVSPRGAARNHYVFVDHPRREYGAFRAELRRNVEAIHGKASEHLALHSVYVYERNTQLNPSFTGDADALRGVHDHALVAYARWQHGVLDIFWMIERGEVVFDVLANQPVVPPFEFD